MQATAQEALLCRCSLKPIHKKGRLTANLGSLFVPCKQGFGWENIWTVIQKPR